MPGRCGREGDEAGRRRIAGLEASGTRFLRGTSPGIAAVLLVAVVAAAVPYPSTAVALQPSAIVAGYCVSLSPPHYDSGYDRDGSGLFDFLVLNINVTNRCDSGASIELSARLYDSSGRAVSMENRTYVDLSPGFQTIPMLFRGWTLWASGIDGPYFADVYLYEYSTYPPESDGHETQAYSHLDFDPGPARFAAQHADYGTDTDADGRFNSLDVDARLDVGVGHTYWVQGFFGWGGLADATTTVLDPGARTITFSFDGFVINASGRDGPHSVYLQLFDVTLGELVALGEHRTAAYPHTDFEEPPLILSGASSSVPAIDGVLTTAEWSEATVVNLSSIADNRLPALILVKNDLQTLYVAYDAVGDTSEDARDGASVAFDTGNDGVATAGREDHFAHGGVTEIAQAHLIYYPPYDEYPDFWDYDCWPFDRGRPNHEGLDLAWGFGATPFSPIAHRVYEFSIPLALLGVRAGETIGFLSGSWVVPGVFDGSNGNASVWPEGADSLPVFGYGDLLLSGDGVPPTVEITSPAPGSLLPRNSTTVTWTAGDFGTGLDRFEVSLDSEVVAILPGTESDLFLTDLVDGWHGIIVTAVDHAGNAGNASLKVWVDTTAPTVTITAPVEGANLSTRDVTVRWSASDASGFASFRLLLDGKTPASVPGWKRDYTFGGVGDGAHTVHLTAVDAVGHTGTASVEFSVDTGSPSVTILSPAPGVLGTADIQVTWSASDLGTGIGGFDVSLDEGEPTRLPNTQFSHTFAGVPDGLHAIEVRALDPAGNIGSASVAVVVDTAVPSVAVREPAPGALVGRADVTITWSATDATSGVREIEVVVDGERVAVLYPPATTYVASELGDGAHILVVSAIDGAGNRATAAVSITVDTTPPSLGISEPASGSYLPSRDVVVGWVASDAATDLAHVEVRVDGGPPTALPGSARRHVLTGLGDGRHIVEVAAEDLAGHASTATVVFSVDVTRPSLTVVSPTRGAILATTSVELVWLASDATSGLERIDVSVDGVDVGPLSPGSSSYLAAGLADGTHTLVVSATDRVGNVASDSRTIIVDTVPPALTLVGPLPNTRTDDPTIMVSGVAEPGAIVAINGARAPVAPDGSFSLPIALVEGTNPITAVATDPAGNTATETVYVIYANPVPGLGQALAEANRRVAELVGQVGLLAALVAALTVSLVGLAFGVFRKRARSGSDEPKGRLSSGGTARQRIPGPPRISAPAGDARLSRQPFAESGPLRLTAKERVLLHLLGLARHADAAEVPPEMTQVGIAWGADVDLRHFAQYVRPLIRAGFVEERKAHVKGTIQRRKVYALTDGGRRRAIGIRDRVRSELARIQDERGERPSAPSDEAPGR